MSKPRRVIAILNASAGAEGKQAPADRLTALFKEAGIDGRVVLARSGEEIARLARDAVSERPDIIVAGGGDGSINAVASVLIDTPIALGVLPLGTLNHFAKALGLPMDVDAAAAVVIAGHTTQVDIGEVNGRIFLNNSSLGLYPRLVRHREAQQEQLGRGKWPAALWAAVAVLRRHALLDLRLAVDDREIRRRTALVFVGNNVYAMSGLHIGERERLDAGQLGVYVAHRGGRLGLLRLALRALFGQLRAAADFDALVTTGVDIETRRARLSVAIDGEVTSMTAPLHYRTRPRALRVIVADAPAPTVG